MADDPNLHPSEKKLIDEMKKELGSENVRAMSPDFLSASDVDSTGLIIVTMNNAAEAAGMAHTCNEAVARNPSIRFLFGINGYEDDPRELDVIPEARIVLRTLFQSLSQKAFHRFDIENQAMMLVAMNVGHRAGLSLHVPPWMIKDPK